MVLKLARNIARVVETSDERGGELKKRGLRVNRYIGWIICVISSSTLDMEIIIG